MYYHMAAFLMGFIMDMLFGDPYFLPHPVRLIGRLISGAEGRLLRKNDEYDDSVRLKKGVALAVIVPVITMAATAFLLLGAYGCHPVLGIAVETVMTYQILAAKCLKT